MPSRLVPMNLNLLPLTPPPSDSSPPSTTTLIYHQDHPHHQQPSSPPSTSSSLQASSIPSSSLLPSTSSSSSSSSYHHPNSLHQPTQDAYPPPSFYHQQPSRRINFEAPATPTTHTASRFSSSPHHPQAHPISTLSYHSHPQHQLQPHHTKPHDVHLSSYPNHSQLHRPSSDWDGTLSATITNWFNHLRETLFPHPAHHQLHHPASPSTKSLPSSNLPPLVQKLFNIPKYSSTRESLINSPNSSNLWFGFLCSLWYSSSALSSNTGKVILNVFKFPVTLTIVQFAFVALWSGIFLILRHHHYSSSPAGFGLSSLRHHRGTTMLIQSLGIRIPNRSTIRGTCIMSLFSIAGHVFSSMAISRVPVSTVHTIKALSPLFTVIAYAGLFGVRYRLTTYLSLLPLTLGVMLACSFDMRANGIGFLCALGSTIIFVSQNIFGKKLLPKESPSITSTTGTHKSQLAVGGGTSSHQMDKLNLLFYSSTIAFFMMVPIWIYTDLGSLWVRSSMLEPELSHSKGSHRSTHTANPGSIGLASYFIFNGTVHFVQCILAFSILSRTSPVTYSIASLIKRIAVICIAIVWFGQKVSIVQAFGMVLTFAGLYIYNQSKSEIDRGEKRRGQIERRQEIVLPTTSNDLEDLSEDQELKTFNSQYRDPKITFEDPFRRTSIVSATSVNHLPSTSINPSEPLLSNGIGIGIVSNSNSRVINNSIVTTRQRAPSIPHSSYSSLPPSTTAAESPFNHSHPYYPNPHHQRLSNPQFNPASSTTTTTPSNNNNNIKPNPTIKSSALQESKPYRPVVNVR